METQLLILHIPFWTVSCVTCLQLIESVWLCQKQLVVEAVATVNGHQCSALGPSVGWLVSRDQRVAKHNTAKSHKTFFLPECWSSFPPCSPSCFEGRCVWMWRRRRRERCASGRPAAAETTGAIWGATTEAPEAPEASWEAGCSANGMGGGRHLEAAWPQNPAWAPGEAPEAKQRVALLPSAAEKSAPRSGSSIVFFILIRSR